MKKIGYEIKTLDNMIERKMFSEAKTVHKDLSLCKEKIVTPINAKIIEYLMENKDKEIYQRDIEQNFKFRKSTASGILATMEKNNIIKRIQIGRSKKIILTDKSLEKMEFINKKINEFEKQLSENISQEEMNTFFDVIAKIKYNVSR